MNKSNLVGFIVGAFISVALLAGYFAMAATKEHHVNPTPNEPGITETTSDLTEEIIE